MDGGGAVVACLLLMLFSTAAQNEGCFERIAVGRRISADKVIAANVSAATTLTLCKQACQQRGPLCASFAFGIGNQLEATCDLGAALWRPPAVRIHSTSTIKLTSDNSSEPPQPTTATTQNGTKEEEPDSIPGNADVDFDLYVRQPSSVCERSSVGESTGILRPLPSSAPSIGPSSSPAPPHPSPSPSVRPSSHPSASPSVRPSPSPVPPSPHPSPSAPSNHPPTTSSPSRGASWNQRYPPPSVHLKPPPLFQPPLPPIRSTPTLSPTYNPPPPSFHHSGPPHRSGHPWPPHFSDCFRRVGMGRLLPNNFVHRTVPSVGLDQCRVACTTEEHFRCEGFVYRWDETLCQLTAVPLSSLEFRHVGENDRVEYFARDGRGPCPSHPQGPSWRPPPTQDHAHQMPTGSLPGFYGTVRPDSPVEQTVREEGFSWSGASHFPHSSDRSPAADSSAGMWQKQPWSQQQECFVLVKRGFRLTADGQAQVSGDDQSNDVLFVSMRVHSRGPEQCARECFQSRLFQCQAFSYRFNGDPRTQGLSNCDLSGQPLQKLDPYQDLMQDRDYDVYGRTRGRACGDDAIMMASLDSPLQNAFPPSRSPPPSPPPPLPPYLDNSLGPGSSWSTDVKEQVGDVTVGGLPCAAGTSCTRHPDGGFWGCPVAKGQGGKAVRKDWDYCCRPGHHCGYSEGYHLPWCYVGSADRDQWRPCSQPQGAGNRTKGDLGITNSYAYLHSAPHDPVHKDTVTSKPSTTEDVKEEVIQKVYQVLKSGMVNERVRGEGNALESVGKRPVGREQKGNRTYGRRADHVRYFRTSPHHHSSLGKQ